MTSADALGPLGSGAPVLAFDVGGTDTKSALIGADGRVLGLRRTPTPLDPADPAGAVVASIGALARRHLDESPGLAPVAVGVSVPGLVDEVAGVGIFASNLGWRDAPIRDLAEAATGLPVAFGHDVRAAGDAEHRLGAARGYGDVVVLAIGTGIASSLILDGHPYSGGGYAGEFGHSLADPLGEPCACGAIGCLETIASAGAIARRYRRASGNPVTGAKDVLDAAGAGDPIARRVWNDAVESLARALARVVANLAPEAIVIGGGLAQSGASLFDPLAERLDALLSFHRRPALVHAELGDDAGLLGTALAARDLAAVRAAEVIP
ncbi:ROK family protein [Agromyces sp. SYSU K20354]|uniref:ROK family protein n=1 Tax=Agromyces cavernae TaxID=2898659 RepID=UPI001E44C598|nr:ROK family protein [Agromyces cavernae]MCD2441766.1 ROK family protein [Agromyces cavernae]